MNSGMFIDFSMNVNINLTQTKVRGAVVRLDLSIVYLIVRYQICPLFCRRGGYMSTKPYSFLISWVAFHQHISCRAG